MLYEEVSCLLLCYFVFTFCLLFKIPTYISLPFILQESQWMSLVSYAAFVMTDSGTVPVSLVVTLDAVIALMSGSS